ncbi:hypothetical protein [Allochromatium warmingii]|uniref:hypothetical protein n=1 Tax=Allochromatium warmingii TaxID=61595 RepID=UPI0011603289|nr:hypothetical protein [Allochromatium warmingii]
MRFINDSLVPPTSPTSGTIVMELGSRQARPSPAHADTMSLNPDLSAAPPAVAAVYCIGAYQRR